MPTYEYRCLKCGHMFEEFQNMSDPAVSRCPKCKGRVQKLISAGGGVIVRKGAADAPRPSCGRDTACPGCQSFA